jgi:hypothetical protein
MGLTMQQKQAVTREYKPRYQKAAKKEKQTLLDEFTRLAGCHRKSAVRLLNARPVREALVALDGKPVKLRPEKKRPPNRKGKRRYTDEAIASLRLAWAFFWHKCGKILAPLMRQQTPHSSEWPAFNIAPLSPKNSKPSAPPPSTGTSKRTRKPSDSRGKASPNPVVP